ncbi:MAG: SRPBCC family protein [Nocardioides sp.]
MTDIAVLEESVEIAAAPERVWTLVTDLPRMASWSPQVVRTLVRAPVRAGTRAVNLNRRLLLVWPTTSKVVRFEPHREFAFRVVENGAVWSFSLAPTATGTRLTQRREVPDGLTAFSRLFTRGFLGGREVFTAELCAGMRETLDRLKADAEA